VGSIRTINTSEITYASTYPSVGFNDLAHLGPSSAGAGGTSTNAGLIDSVLASGTKSGYTFVATAAGGTPFSTYTVTGDPSNAQTGTRHFCSDQSGVIRFNAAAAIGTNSGANCDPAASPLQ
jgi:hypothetical protein